MYIIIIILILNNIKIEKNTNIISYINETPLKKKRIEDHNVSKEQENSKLNSAIKNTNENEYMDSLFESIKKYQFSEDKPESGIVQCVNECPGTCVADGYTGSAWCF